MEWSKNNRACTTLWTSLYSTKQIGTSFSESGKIKMSELTYYNPLVSADLKKQQATMLAEQLDNIFRNARGAHYEEGVLRDKAISSMVNVMSKEENTLCELAGVVDAAYLFWGEVKLDLQPEL